MSEKNQLGRYVLIEKIASGGMADVYHSKLCGVAGFEKDVAIKKILPHWSGNREFVDMLIDEAKVLLHLTHPNIVQVFELNQEDDIYYLVMEYVRGVDLRSLLHSMSARGQTLPLPLVPYLAMQVCEGLRFAHEKKDSSQRFLGIVHRDISPQNILISLEGQVKVTDFGIAKIVGRTNETQTGTLKGKFAYMSPEQAQGLKVDHQTDIFALGIVLYEMLTGQRCFKGSNDLDTLEAVKKAEIHFPDFVTQQVPQEFLKVVSKALKKNKEERYQTIGDLIDDLHQQEKKMGSVATAQDLKAYLVSHCPQIFSEKRIHPETLDKLETKHLEGIGTQIEKNRSRVLVSATQVMQGEEARPTWKTYLKTFVIKSPIQLSQTTPLKISNPHRTIKYYIPIMLAVLFVTGGALIFWKSRLKAVLPNVSASLPPVVFVQKNETPPLALPPVYAPAPELVKTEGLQTFQALFQVEAKPEGSRLVLRSGTNEWIGDQKLDLSLDLSDPKEFSLLVEKEGFKKIEKKIFITAQNPRYAETMNLEKINYGSLTVAAKPWGRVYVASIVRGAETPFLNKKIPEGNYQLKVVFPPQQKTVATTIQVAGNVSIRCQAVFDDRSTIHCR